MARSVTPNTAAPPETPYKTATSTVSDAGQSDDGALIPHEILEAGGSKSAAAAVSVGSTATLILAANPQRRKALVVNNGAANSATVYLGRDATVTTATGLPLVAGGGMLEDDISADAWYGIVSSGTQDVRVVEIS